MAVHHQYQKIVAFIAFALALFLLFQLVRPMITILLSSVLLAYIAFPLYMRIMKRARNKSLSIILALFLIFIIILVPLSFLAFGITQQGYYFYNSLSDKIDKGALFGFGCVGADSKVCSFINQVEKFSLERLSSFSLDEQIQKSMQVFEEKIADVIRNIPIIIAEILFTFVIAYFILKEQKHILKKIVDLLPVDSETIKILIKEFGNIAHTVIYAQLFVTLAQGIIGIIGFYLFGVPFPILLGVILAFCALIPTIGTAIVWLPVSLFFILSGYFTHDYLMLGKGVGLFLYGLLIISIIDNMLLWTIVHAKANVNQIMVIVGVIGGASMFGVMGLFIGPILLPLLITYFKSFKERFV